MNTCPNCGRILSEDEKILYKCMSCKQKIKFEHISYQARENENEEKNILCKFLIGVFIILAVVCLLFLIGSNDEYIIAKGNIALEKTNLLKENIWNLNPQVDTSELDKIIFKRNICIGGIVIGIIGTIVCYIILIFNKQKETKVEKFERSNYSTQSKLQELEEIYKNNLITQEEYVNKRKEIISKL